MGSGSLHEQKKQWGSYYRICEGRWSGLHHLGRDVCLVYLLCLSNPFVILVSSSVYCYCVQHVTARMLCSRRSSLLCHALYEVEGEGWNIRQGIYELSWTVMRLFYRYKRSWVWHGFG